ncbi:hypothetical protein NDU88_004156 [Pleurodeles waltl]|uniref:Uncharacterized protein n=1 Tax=Pleurodeles waltl TaxID=8319 RepID=A0AAV7MSN7_PLEWA|nr:hypothetical protein NDU88_004156 [Pleurodeles waltl]
MWRGHGQQDGRLFALSEGSRGRPQNPAVSCGHRALPTPCVRGEAGERLHWELNGPSTPPQWPSVDRQFGPQPQNGWYGESHLLGLRLLRALYGIPGDRSETQLEQRGELAPLVLL